MERVAVLKRFGSVFAFLCLQSMTDTDDDVPARFRCDLTGKIMHLPVRLRSNHFGFIVDEGYVCERKALMKKMKKYPVFKRFTIKQLRSFLEPVTALRDEIQETMKERADKFFAAEQTAKGKHLAAWRGHPHMAYIRIRDVVPGALRMIAHLDEAGDVHAFMDARCQGEMWIPREEDIRMAAEISRWHADFNIRGEMYAALGQALGLPQNSLSPAQKVLAKNGYFNAMESHYNGGQDVWILNGVKWCKMELAKQEWDDKELFRYAMCLTTTRMLQGRDLNESETRCVRDAYISSVYHCPYTDRIARQNWAVDWAVARITESRVLLDKDARQALVDESVREEAKQSRKRSREQYREDRKVEKRLIRETPRKLREERLAKLRKKRDDLKSRHALLHSLDVFKDVLERLTDMIARCEQEIEEVSPPTHVRRFVFQ